MCKYCDFGRFDCPKKVHQFYVDFGVLGEKEVSLMLNPGAMYIGLPYEDYDVKIEANYCPFCGDKLISRDITE